VVVTLDDVLIVVLLATVLGELRSPAAARSAATDPARLAAGSRR